MVTTSVQPTYTLEQAEDDIATLRGQIDQLSEVLSLVPGPVPGTPSSGTSIYADPTGQPAWVDAAGLQMNASGAQLCTFPGTTVTAASLSNLATFTVPANDPEPGATYELEVFGNGTWGSTAQTLSLQCTYGSQTPAGGGLNIGASTFNTSQNFRWHACCRVWCVTTGSGGTWQFSIHGEVSVDGVNLVPGTTANNTGGFNCCTTTAVTVSTIANQTLALQASWNSTTGAPTLTSQLAIPKRIA